ncbi:MAG: hypothetical protein BRC26_03580, partial [Nanohaloarchaea archaeon QH_8_44_6]
FLEFFLKARNRFDAHSWGLLEGNELKNQHESIYSLTHVFMARGMNEKEITASLITLEVVVVLLGLALFL